MASFNFNCLFKSPISKYSHILGYRNKTLTQEWGDQIQPVTGPPLFTEEESLKSPFLPTCRAPQCQFSLTFYLPWPCKVWSVGGETAEECGEKRNMHELVSVFSLWSNADFFSLRKFLVTVTPARVCVCSCCHHRTRPPLLPWAKLSPVSVLLFLSQNAYFNPMCNLPAGIQTLMKNRLKETFLKPTVHTSPERTCDHSGNSSVHYALNSA